MASDKQMKPLNQTRTKESQSTLVRLSKIPTIEFLIYLSLSIYSRVKSSSELVNNLLSGFERFGQTTINGLRPLANKFEKQISYVDSVGGVWLDKIETAVPVVTTFQPKTTYANVANRLLVWNRYFSSQVNVVRNFNLNKTVSSGLKSIDNLVDDYLPGSADETVEGQNEEKQDGLFSQVSAISNKLRKRGVRRLQNIQRLVF